MNNKAINSLLLISSLLSDQVYALPSHLQTTGYVGTRSLGKFDYLQSLTFEPNSAFYLDFQGKTANDGAGFAGFGSGYRIIHSDRIFGGYLFVDHSESEHNKSFWVLNPGVETIGNLVDLHLNGYFPLNHRHIICNWNYDENCPCSCAFTQFSGHQQFYVPYHKVEQVGAGGDAEVTVKLPLTFQPQLGLGGYFYHQEQLSDIKGIAGRVELPLDAHLALTAQASYDNQQRGAVIAGLTLKLGALPIPNQIQSHLYDPVIRQIGTVKTGAGIPILTRYQCEQPVILQDNIFFFTQNSGSAFSNVENSGTFENPLNSNQLNQTVINQLGPDATLFLNSGTYMIAGENAPNAQLSLLEGQSLLGRTTNYRCPAQGTQRPTILGQINLLEGNNTLDSINLVNSFVSSGLEDSNQIALSIQNSANITIANSVITINSLVAADNNATNLATAIAANNSVVSIIGSTVTASALVTGTNFAYNAATAIGGINQDASGNTFILTDSTLTSNAFIGGNNQHNPDSTEFFAAVNMANGIGATALELEANFTNNSFELNNTSIQTSATISQNNFTDFNLIWYGINSAIAIGNNVYNNTGVFTNNSFIINNSSLTNESQVLGVNNGNIFATAIGNVGQLNIAAPQATFADFVTNSFEINNSQITTNAFEQDSANVAVGIGVVLASQTATNIGNLADGASINFTDNQFTVSNVALNTTARVAQNNAFYNLAANIGSILPNADQFTSNQFTIAHSSLNAIAITQDNVPVLGFIPELSAYGIRVGDNNLFFLNQNQLSVTANVVGVNLGIVTATELTGGAGTHFISD